MYPSCDSVEYATTRLMSFWMMPRNPMNSAVIAPTMSIIDSAVSESSNSGDMRATMKMPAVTIVAAWISEEIAVGRVYQKPISRYDTRPTASQPKNSCRKLLLITSISIEKVKSEMYAKKRL